LGDQIEEATKAADRIEAAMRRLRLAAHGAMSPADRAASARQLESLAEQLRHERGRLQNLTRIRRSQADRHLDAVNLARREESMLDAKIRIARDLVRNAEARVA
jgi:hypothetical protein